MIDCLEKLGAEVRISAEDLFEVRGISNETIGCDLHLSCRESGVTINFLSGIASILPGNVILDGDSGLLGRPIGELVEGLRQLGVKVRYLGEKGYPPIEISSDAITGGTSVMAGSITSQYFSSLAIASVFSDSDTSILCDGDMLEKPYLDITLEMMGQFGVTAHHNQYREIRVQCGQKYKPAEIWIEGDYTSASYFLVGAAICGGTIEIHRLKSNSSQGDRLVIELLRDMGCDIDINDDVIRLQGRELRPIDCDLSDNPDLVPSLAVAASFCEGISYIRNIEHLRYKESDRITSMINGLNNMGVQAGCSSRDLVIFGNPHQIHGAEIRSYNDHRVAMSFAVAGLRVGGIVIDNEKCVEKSYPDFWIHFQKFYQ